MYLIKRYTLFQKVTLLALLLTITPVSAAPQTPQPGDTKSLHGLDSVNSIFMLNIKKPGRLSHVLSVVEKTKKGMRKQGVKARIIVVIIGSSAAFLTRDRRGISYVDQRYVAAVQKGIHKLKELGIRIEVCNIALQGMDISPANILPDVDVVGNGFISAIGYQAQGYELVPVY